THHPIETVVVMLGTNDIKVQFDRSPAEIAAALTGYLDDVEANATTRAGGVPRTVLVSPIHLDDRRPAFAEMTLGNYDSAAVEKSRLLSDEIRRVARDRGTLFADAATVAHAGGDGLHLSLDSHQRLAHLVAALVTNE